MSGCDFEMKHFSVFMNAKDLVNKCFSCSNNKYYGGNEDICDECIKGNNYKPNASKGVTLAKRQQARR